MRLEEVLNAEALDPIALMWEIEKSPGLRKLYRYFDTDSAKPMTAIEFWRFWNSLSDQEKYDLHALNRLY